MTKNKEAHPPKKLKTKPNRTTTTTHRPTDVLVPDARHDVGLTQEGLEGFIVPLVLGQHFDRHLLAATDRTVDSLGVRRKGKSEIE
jgi:hypothetical protein